MKDFKPAFMPDGKIVETPEEFAKVFRECGLDAPDFYPALPCLVCVCAEGFCMLDNDEITKLFLDTTKEG